MSEAVQILTPVGRFIMGDAFTGNNKNMAGAPRVNKKGEPATQWFMGIAIPKADPGWADMWAQIAAVAQRDFPGGQFNNPSFSWKVSDGDTKYPDRPECAGHMVVRMSSGFAPRIFNSENQQITDPTQIKRGDYIRAYISVVGNGDMNKPGVYVNHQMIQLCGYGEEIRGGPDATEVFGGSPVTTLPPGASATPVAPAAGMPAMPGAVPVGVTTVAQPVYAPMPNPMPAAPAPTAPGGMPGIPAAPAPASPIASPGSAPPPHPTILQGPQE